MDNAKPFKYATEAGLNFLLDHRAIMCQQDEFESFEKSPEHFKYLKDCNIYFICRRNRIGILPNSIKANGETIFLTFQFWEGDNKYDFPICIDNNSGSTKLTTISKYPHSHFEIRDEQGNNYFSSKASYVADDKRACIFPNANFLDFEILYIGQAMDESDKPTFNRLIKHETLQKIYLENTPDKEIFIFLFPLFINGDIEIRGTVKSQKEYENEDAKRLERFISTGLKIPKKQQVSIAEAAFIKYFQPKYNSHHVGTFPTNRNSSYDELYKMDFNTISLQLNTSKTPIEMYFYTETVKPCGLHSHSFFLPTEADRRKIFDYSIGFDDETKTKNKT